MTKYTALCTESYIDNNGEGPSLPFFSVGRPDSEHDEDSAAGADAGSSGSAAREHDRQDGVHPTQGRAGGPGQGLRCRRHAGHDAEAESRAADGHPEHAASSGG